MSILSVVRDVALAVGVNQPTTMFGASMEPRTQAELLALANEMAQRIAYDVREWTKLKAINIFTGPGTVDVFGSSHFALPANYKRMLLTSQVYPSWQPTKPPSFVSNSDLWLQNRMLNYVNASWGEWTLLGEEFLIHPALEAGQSVAFLYLDKNCVRLNAGGFGDRFMNDLDEFRLDERLLKLNMIWQWKQNKGSPYAEEMGTFVDALMMVAGADKPSPILIDTPPRLLPGGVNALLG